MHLFSFSFFLYLLLVMVVVVVGGKYTVLFDVILDWKVISEWMNLLCFLTKGFGNSHVLCIDRIISCCMHIVLREIQWKWTPFPR